MNATIIKFIINLFHKIAPLLMCCHAVKIEPKPICQ